MKQTLNIIKVTSNIPVLERSTSEKPRSLEDAISLAEHGKFHYILLVGVGLCLFSLMFETISTSYLLPSAQCDFNMSTSDKGLLNSAIYIGMIVSSHMWGFLADTRGRRKLLIITLLLNATTSVIASIVPTFTLFIICRFFNGIFICCSSAVSYAYLGEFHSNKTRTKALLWATAFLSLGTIFLPAMAWLVIPQNWVLELPWCLFKSWRAFVIFCTMPGVVAAVFLTLLLYESPKFLLAVGREEEALQVLQKIYAINTGNDPDLYPVTSLKLEDTAVRVAKSVTPLAVLKSMWDQTKPIFMPPYLCCALMACFIQYGLYASSNGFLLWLPDLFNRIEDYKRWYPNDTLTVCNAVHAYNPFSLPSSPIATEASVSVFQSKLLGMYTNPDDLNSTTEPNRLIGTTVTDGIFGINRVSGDGAPGCTGDVSVGAFQNTLIIGASSAIVLVLVNYSIDYIQKKTILLICLLTAGACGCALYFAQSTTEVLALAACFTCLSGMCVCVINSVVVDAFPTHLRAMALCLSLMMGRVGTVSSNIILGLLLDVNCALVVFLLSGIVLACGAMSFFLPTTTKENQESNNLPP